MTVTRLKRKYQVIVWPVVQVLLKYGDRLLDNFIVLALALMVAEAGTLALHVAAALYVANQWYMCWTLGEHFRVSHHRNFYFDWKNRNNE